MDKESAFKRLYESDLRAILQDESDYLKAFEKRISSLQSISVSTPQLTEALDVSISLTEQAHSLSLELLSNMEFVEAKFPSTTAEQLSLHFLRTEALSSSTEIDEVSSDILENVAEIRRKGNDFLQWVMTGKAKEEGVDPDLSILEVLNERFGAESDLDRQLLASHIGMQHTLFKAFQTQLNALPPIYSLAAIFRGILYVGIFSGEGGRLERENKINRLIEVGKELAGAFVPGLGLVLALSSALKAWLELDATPEMMKHADFVNKYLNTYSALLNDWITRVEVLNSSLASSATAVLAADNA